MVRCFLQFSIRKTATACFAIKVEHIQMVERKIFVRIKDNDFLVYLMTPSQLQTGR
jgi:hypothetical protein